MTARYLGDSGPGRPRRELPRGIRNHLVVAALEIPAWFGLPGRFSNCAAKGINTPWHLGIGYECGGHQQEKDNTAGSLIIANFLLDRSDLSATATCNRTHLRGLVQCERGRRPRLKCGLA